MRNNEESSLQIAFASFMRYAYPDVIHFHCPNEGTADIRRGALMKLRGVLPGVMDNILLFGNRQFAALELKRGSTKAKYSPSQQAFADNLDRVGFPHAVANDGPSIIAALRSFGLPDTPYKFPTLTASENNLRMQYIHLVQRGLNPPCPRGMVEVENLFTQDC